MNMKEMGQEMRQRREARQAGIEDVSLETKISWEAITALEEGKLELLPHLVYAKGFVRTYAKFLEMDEQACIDAVCAAYGKKQDQDEKKSIQKVPVTKAEKKRTGTFLFFLLTIFLFIAGVFFLTKEKDSTVPQVESGSEPTLPLSESMHVPDLPEQGQSSQKRETVPEPQSEPESLDTVSVSEEQNSLQPEIAQDVPSVQEQSVDFQDPLLQGSAPQQDFTGQDEQAAADRQGTLERDNSQSQTIADEPTVIDISNDQVVEIEALKRCWVQAYIDKDSGTPQKDVLLNPKDRYKLVFKKNMRLKLGNAGGIRLFLNGKEYKFTAKDGEIREFRFAVES